MSAQLSASQLFIEGTVHKMSLLTCKLHFYPVYKGINNIQNASLQLHKSYVKQIVLSNNEPGPAIQGCSRREVNSSYLFAVFEQRSIR